MKQALISFFCVVTVIALFTACRNTASGFGKDVENAGEKIQEKVN